jgi:hypothetical protein
VAALGVKLRHGIFYIGIFETSGNRASHRKDRGIRNHSAEPEFTWCIGYLTLNVLLVWDLFAHHVWMTHLPLFYGCFMLMMLLPLLLFVR